MKQIRLIVLTALTFFSSVSWAQMDGEGTEKNPYQVKTPEDLFDVRMDLSANYKLMNDIDLTEWIQEESPKQGWTPIGTEATPFLGKFDGNNKSIKGLYINKPNADDIGLFGYSESGTICNVCIISPYIIGHNNVGVFVGRTHPQKEYYIKNNSCIGGRIEGDNRIGGILGSIDGYISGRNGYDGCDGWVSGNFSSIDVKGNSLCGGIIGCVSSYVVYNSSLYRPFILDNHFAGTVTATSKIGGIIGACYVARTDYQSRFAGCVCGNIYNNITRGCVWGGDYTNGILGEKDGYDISEYPFSITNNVCALDTISGSSPYRSFRRSLLTITPCLLL